MKVLPDSYWGVLSLSLFIFPSSSVNVTIFQSYQFNSFKKIQIIAEQDVKQALLPYHNNLESLVIVSHAFWFLIFLNFRSHVPLK